MKIIVCTISLGESYSQQTKYSTRSKEIYCKKHGYTFLEGSDRFYDKSRNITWSKIPMLLACLDFSCDYVVWIDADIMIMNTEIKLEDIINNYMQQKTFMMCRDNGNQINTGFWFAKNNEYARKMLMLIQSHPDIQKFTNDNYAEQGSFMHLYDQNTEQLQENSTILSIDEQKIFNCSLCFYKTGYFNIHFLGVGSRQNLLGQVIEEMYPYKMDEESSEQAEERIKKSREHYNVTDFYRFVHLPNIRRKICVCSFNVGEKYKQATKYSHLSKKLYCEKWGYGFCDDESIYDPSRHPAWSKIPLLKKCMQQKNDNGEQTYDFIVWIDADAMIMNNEIHLEDFIDKYMKPGKDFLVCRDNGYRINTGVWFMRNCEYTNAILDKVWNNTTEGEMEYWEQGSFCHFYNKNDNDLQEHTIVLNTDQQKEFNCSYCFFVYGMFIVHYLVMRDLRVLQEKIEEMYMHRKEDEDEQLYIGRINWLKDFYSKCLFERFPPE